MRTVSRHYLLSFSWHCLDELDEAIHITAESLGKDWAQLYQKLPFKPYRDFENRSRDIEGKQSLVTIPFLFDPLTYIYLTVSPQMVTYAKCKL